MDEPRTDTNALRRLSQGLAQGGLTCNEIERLRDEPTRAALEIERLRRDLQDAQAENRRLTTPTGWGRPRVRVGW